MIDNIAVRNFKGIRALDLKCKGLTLLAGANASGKSTILQTLLLLLQTKITKTKSRISLNGKFVQLGTAGEIEYFWSENSVIDLGFSTDAGELNLSFKVELTDPRDVIDLKTGSAAKDIKFIKSIKYLSANRIGPSFTFPHSTNEISSEYSIGILGEYTFAFLAKYGDRDLVVDELIHPGAENHGIKSSLIANVTAWMQIISPGVSFKPEILQDIGASKITYGYPGLGATPSLSSHNVGFGITYVLPVITRVLMSSPGDILVLENPEAHVHPRGQVELGKLLALASQNGVQIFLETHSDHIFNGIQLQLRNSIRLFEDCAMYFAMRDEVNAGKFETTFREILLTDRGKIREAPTGFFDEWESAIMDLL